jgi:hypothetical protein
MNGKHLYNDLVGVLKLSKFKNRMDLFRLFFLEKNSFSLQIPLCFFLFGSGGQWGTLLDTQQLNA